ncbi:MAG: hypothetical protein ABIE74_07530, partial [Pseudomonadota bacterium]
QLWIYGKVDAKIVDRAWKTKRPFSTPCPQSSQPHRLSHISTASAANFMKNINLKSSKTTKRQKYGKTDKILSFKNNNLKTT